MSVLYEYTKENVCSPCLTREIETSADITTTFERVQYNAPDDLNVYFADTLTTEEETALDAIVAAHDGTQSQHWTIWCDSCGDYTEYWGPTFPTVCPISGESEDYLIDVTGDRAAMHGYSVRETEPGGYYEWWVGAATRRHAKHRMFIKYDSKLTFYPTIQLGTVIYDGLADLRVLYAGKEGFVVECTVTQIHKKFGGLNVKFTWSGVKPS